MSKIIHLEVYQKIREEEYEAFKELKNCMGGHSPKYRNLICKSELDKYFNLGKKANNYFEKYCR